MMRHKLRLAVFCAAVLAALGGCEGAGSSTAQTPRTDVASAASPGTPLSNPNGPCLVLRGVRNKVIENQTIGPCGGNGVEIWDSQGVTLRNLTIRDTKDSGVYIYGSSTVEVAESKIQNTISGVSAVESGGLSISCNTIEDPRGPIPKGQFVQFDKVVGGANQISCNTGLSRPGRGVPEDGISLYKSNGSASQPISVLNNLLIGGGPSQSGGGIMLGDNGGSYQIARGNVVVDPGQYGVSVSGGVNMSIEGNLVYARQQAFTNVGIAVWNQNPSACAGVKVANNQVNWRSRTGNANPFWDGRNCGPIAGVDSNNFAAPLSADIASMSRPAECTCKSQGRR